MGFLILTYNLCDLISLSILLTLAWDFKVELNHMAKGKKFTFTLIKSIDDLVELFL